MDADHSSPQPGETQPVDVVAPIDVRSVSLAVLTTIAVIFVLHWSRTLSKKKITVQVCERVPELNAFAELLGSEPSKTEPAEAVQVEPGASRTAA